MIIEAVSSSETSLHIYHTAWCDILEGSHLHFHHRKNFKSNMYFVLFYIFFIQYWQPLLILQMKIYNCGTTFSSPVSLKRHALYSEAQNMTTQAALPQKDEITTGSNKSLLRPVSRRTPVGSRKSSAHCHTRNSCCCNATNSLLQYRHLGV
jgi:hypothetical protein